MKEHRGATEMINLAINENVTRGRTPVSPGVGWVVGGQGGGPALEKCPRPHPLSGLFLPAAACPPLFLWKALALWDLELGRDPREFRNQIGIQGSICRLWSACNLLTLWQCASYLSPEPQFSHLPSGGLHLKITIIADICRTFLCTRHCTKCFAYVTLFSPYIRTMR